MAWDPAPLPWGWWLPAQSATLAGDPGGEPPAACGERSRGYVLMHDFGRTNNNLLAWAHALELVAPVRDPPLTLVLAPEFEKSTAPWFDWRAATAGWACVVTRAEVPRNATLTPLDGPEGFFLPQQPTGNLFVAIALRQLLLRPVPALRTAVRTFEQRHADGYDGLHLRSFENVGGQGCERWVTAAALLCQSVRARDMPGRRNVTGADVCSMTEEYLRAALVKLGSGAEHAGAHRGTNHTRLKRGADGGGGGAVTTLPLLVAHDGQNTQRLIDLKSKFGGVEAMTLEGGPSGGRSVWKGSGSLFVDLLLLVRARAFVGNPGSTVSQNVASVRSLVKPPGTTSMRPCPEALNGAAKWTEAHAARLRARPHQHGTRSVPAG